MATPHPKPRRSLTIPATYKPCSDRLECKGYQRALELLTFWAIDTTIHGTGIGRHFVLTIRDYWSSRRRECFAAALVMLTEQNGHEHGE